MLEKTITSKIILEAKKCCTSKTSAFLWCALNTDTLIFAYYPSLSAFQVVYFLRNVCFWSYQSPLLPSFSPSSPWYLTIAKEKKKIKAIYRFSSNLFPTVRCTHFPFSGSISSLEHGLPHVLRTKAAPSNLLISFILLFLSQWSRQPCPFTHLQSLPMSPSRPPSTPKET